MLRASSLNKLTVLIHLLLVIKMFHNLNVVHSVHIALVLNKTVMTKQFGMFYVCRTSKQFGRVAEME